MIFPPKEIYSGNEKVAKTYRLEGLRRLEQLHQLMNFKNLFQNVSTFQEPTGKYEIVCHAIRNAFGGFQSIVAISAPFEERIIIEEEEEVESVYRWYVLVAIGSVVDQTTEPGHSEGWVYGAVVNTRIEPGATKINSIINALENPPTTVNDIADNDETWIEIREIIYFCYDVANFFDFSYAGNDFEYYMRKYLNVIGELYFDKWQAIENVDDTYCDIGFKEQYFVVWDVENNELVAGPGDRLAVENEFEKMDIKQSYTELYTRRFDVESSDGEYSSAQFPLRTKKVDLGVVAWFDFDNYNDGSNPMFKYKKDTNYRGSHRGVERLSGCLPPHLPYPDPYWSSDPLWFTKESHESGGTVEECLSYIEAPQIDSVGEEFEQNGYGEWSVTASGDSWERVILINHVPAFNGNYHHYYRVTLKGVNEILSVEEGGTTGAQQLAGSFKITAQNRSVETNYWHASTEINSYGDANYDWHDMGDPYYECTISAEFQAIYAVEVPLGILADFTEIWNLRRVYHYTGTSEGDLLKNTQGSKVQFHHTKNRNFKGEYAGIGEKTGVLVQFFVHDSETKMADFVENGYDKDPYDPNAGLLFPCNRLTATPSIPSITGVKNLEVTPALTVLASIDIAEDIDSIAPFSQVSHNLDFADIIKSLITHWKTEEGEEENYDIELRVFRG